MSSDSDNSGGDDPDPIKVTFKTRTRQKKVVKGDLVTKPHLVLDDSTKSKKSSPKQGNKRKKKKHHSPLTSSSEGISEHCVSKSSSWRASPKPSPKPSPRSSSRKKSKSFECQREISKKDEAILHKEAEMTRSFCQDKCSFVVEDSVELVHHLEDTYNSVYKTFNKPNVLVTGITGSGKSSLINSMFGKEVAATGTGVPITQHFTKYESDDMPTIIYDSKGLEHGHYQDFIETTNAFFEEHRTGSSAIHVVWYIVNAAHARFEPFEQELCTKLFSSTPIIFLLNKSDISSEKDRDQLRRVISDMKLPNCCGILDVISCSSPKLKSCDVCPRCQSDDVTVRRKTAVMDCGACGYQESVLMDNGLEGVVKASLQVLPEVVRENFIAAQNVSISLKEEGASKVITEFWSDFRHSLTYTHLIEIITRMLARLSLVWEFKGHGNQIGRLLADDLVTCLNWKRKVNFLGHEKKVSPTVSQKLHLTSLGILWNLCLKELSMQLVTAWKAVSTCQLRKPLSDSDISDKCTVLFGNVFFSVVNEKNLKFIELELLSTSVEELLHSGRLQDMFRTLL